MCKSCRQESCKCHIWARAVLSSITEFPDGKKNYNSCAELTSPTRASNVIFLSGINSRKEDAVILSLEVSQTPYSNFTTWSEALSWRFITPRVTHQQAGAALSCPRFHKARGAARWARAPLDSITPNQFMVSVYHTDLQTTVSKSPPSSVTAVYHFCSRMPSKPTNIIQLHQTAVGFVVLKKIAIFSH